ncbi:hypothetical protein FOA52_005078 [Chlamydomonas sp. UWO 241]|nr:hypothetical protein FOA52_005078 [Chlamydomonas sp. UWO 241]
MRGSYRQAGLPARVGDTSLRHSHVLSIPAAAARLVAYGTVFSVEEPVGWDVMSASFLNAIGGAAPGLMLLCVLFTMTPDAVAGAVVRSRCCLREVDPSAAAFDVLSDREEEA